MSKAPATRLEFDKTREMMQALCLVQGAKALGELISNMWVIECFAERQRGDTPWMPGELAERPESGASRRSWLRCRFCRPLRS